MFSSFFLVVIVVVIVVIANVVIPKASFSEARLEVQLTRPKGVREGAGSGPDFQRVFKCYTLWLARISGNDAGTPFWSVFRAFVLLFPLARKDLGRPPGTTFFYGFRRAF